MIVLFEHVCFSYRSALMEEHPVLKDIDLTIGQNEIVAIVGKSGSGKTTLVQHLNGLLTPTSGSVHVLGMPVHDDAAQIHEIRRKVGLVFQFPELQLFEETVEKEVAFAPKNFGQSGQQLQKTVAESLHQVGLDIRIMGAKSPFQLSGGEKRRVAIAGILAMDPEVLVMDEPTVGLDRIGAEQVEKIICSYHEKGKTVLFISHNMDLVARLASRILVVDQGQIIFDGSASALFNKKELLQRAGLEKPQIQLFLEKIRNAGTNIRTDIYSKPEAKEELLRILGKR